MLNNEFYLKWCINCLRDINKEADPVCEILNQAIEKDIRDIKNDDLVKVGNYVIKCKLYERRTLK